MTFISITLPDYKRLMDSILWILNPYIDGNSINQHPHLMELAQCYNDLFLNAKGFLEDDYQLISYE